MSFSRPGPEINYADPVVTASFYSAGRLDEVVARVVVPFRRALRASPPQCSYLLWFLRYARGGEHLKIRLHGPISRCDFLRELLKESGRLYLPRPEGASEEHALGPTDTPFIDEEDRVPAIRPDGDLVWTHAQRSPVLFGAKPLLFDDRYLTLLNTCLGAGCDLVLRAFEHTGDSPMTHQRRQTTLVQILTSGLSICCSEDEIAAFLAYHRDWLVRSRVLVSGSGLAGARRVLARLERELDRLGDSSRELLRHAFEVKGDSGEDPDAELLAWRRAILELRDYLEPLRKSAVYEVDPFVREPLFPSMLKLFHILANQLGLRALDEALAHHLLLSTLRGHASQEFVLIPNQDHLLGGKSPKDRTKASEKFNFEKHYDWVALVEGSGGAGRDWVGRYRVESREILPRIQEAVTRLRDREFERGLGLLREACSRWLPLRHSDPSVFFALGRFCYGGLAYYHYTLDDFRRAERAISRVHQVIRKAVELEPMLLPFAALCTDVPMKRAQISRARQQWTEMQERLEEAREMMLDREPLCILSGGRPLSHAVLGGYLEALPGMVDDHRPAVRYLVEEDLRLRVFEHFASKLYMLPGFIISQT